MDGVLADFDKGAAKMLGTDNIYKFEFVYGQDEFWRLINRNPNFFSELEKMPGADYLVDSLRGYEVKVLTALPKTRQTLVAAQKEMWVRANIGHMPVIACAANEKPSYCKPGDILIDDRALNQKAWEARGGRYIVHTDIGSTLAQLRSLEII